MLTINFDTYEYFYNHVELSIRCKVTKKNEKNSNLYKEKLIFLLWFYLF